MIDKVVTKVDEDEVLKLNDKDEHRKDDVVNEDVKVDVKKVE